MRLPDAQLCEICGLFKRRRKCRVCGRCMAERYWRKRLGLPVVPLRPGPALWPNRALRFVLTAGPSTTKTVLEAIHANPTSIAWALRTSGCTYDRATKLWSPPIKWVAPPHLRSWCGP